MTKRIALAVALTVCAAGAAQAQTTVTARANVPVVTPQAQGVARDLVFPQATPTADGSGSGVAVDGTTTASNASGPQLGYQDFRMNVGGSTVAVPSTLILASASTTTDIEATIECGAGAVGAASVTLADCSGGVPFGYTGPGMDIRRLFVGGSIAQTEINSADPAPDYIGTITLTVTP